MGTGTALQAMGNGPKTFRHCKETKKLMGRMPTDRQGGPKPPFFFAELLSAAFCWQPGPSSIPACQLCSRTIAPRIALALCYPDTQVSSRCLSGANSTQWFNPSPSARGETAWKSWSLRARHHRGENKWTRFKPVPAADTPSCC